MGDSTGLLKLLFDIETHKLLGVGILGEGASELVYRPGGAQFWRDDRIFHRFRI